MAYTQADLDTLQAAIASGTLSIRHGDKEKRFQSLAEMRALRNEMQREIATASGTSRTTYASFSGD